MTKQELFREAQNFMIDGKLQESIDSFTEALEAGYDPVRTYLSRGVALLRKDDFRKAINDFSAVVTIDPDNERGYYYRGVAYLDSNDFDNALDDLNHSIALNPERGSAYLTRGLIESELGCEEDAVRDFKAAVAYSEVETADFAHEFGNYHTLFERSMALLEGDRGPHSIVLTEEEIKKLEKWIEH